MANQRRRKKFISELEGPEGLVNETKDILDVAVNVYKDLFGFEPSPDMDLNSNFWSEEEKVKVEENEWLGRPISEEEVKQAVFESYADGAPGPDGFSFMFFQKF